MHYGLKVSILEIVGSQVGDEFGLGWTKDSMICVFNSKDTTNGRSPEEASKAD